ncbi:MAG: HD domain-containing protein [Gemmatimonadetes bacterium]|jgi:HD-GYP domain-containing protein (c-di-GMP phosphodiesterase class II)|nr:HD domain-containing protein [Gemmatimonadota bacterium]
MPSRLRTTLLAAGAAVYYLKARRERGRVERLAAAALESLLNAIDANDQTTGEHARRVAAVSLILADAHGLDDRDRSSVERVALFHDVGKIHEALFDITHDHHLLSSEERAQVATHPQRGADVVAPLSLFYPDLGAGVLAHHERWDGTGYPRGLRGLEIPLTARIVALADTFDAITCQRRYDAARSAPDAVEVIKGERGRQFDPELADLFLSEAVQARVHEAMHPWHCSPTPHASKRKPESAPGDVPDVAFRWRTAGV